MALIEIINGEEVEMSPEREAAFKAEIAEGSPVVEPAPPEDPVEKLTAFLNANPDVKALVG